MPRAMVPQTTFPSISSVLLDRRLTLGLGAAAGLQIVLVSLRLPSWECPFFHLTGVPCPGCGLTRATMLLLQGDVNASFRFHAFAPIVLLGILMVTLAAVLPKSLIQPLVLRTERLERQTGLTVMILTGLILYWLTRLLVFPAFVQLIRG